ncbi:cytochrome b/b6 domain-containing protein [Thalassotalea crassostreae]|uniref:cytochrome b/b6 domain-containing protein n=1 Tax=Thalassotalea crassostreae TaxID=1763536 RepID=UPI0008A35BD7|nr:cytochrome b/b6 domain-containing protein [Thalassotalea crassostreae]
MSHNSNLGWDILIRFSHWLVASLFLANAFFIEPDAFFSDYINWAALPEFIADASPHEWAGWTILGMLVIRILWGLTFAKGPNRLKDFVPSLVDAKEHLGHLKTRQKQTKIGHNSFGAIAVYFMWTGLAFIIFTGWAQDTDWGFDNNLDQWHQWGVDAMTIFVCIHVMAVISTSLLLKQNLISAMIKNQN